MPRLSTQLKVTSGYILLTLLLFASIQYINHEMQALTETDDNETILNLRRRVTNEIVGQLYQAGNHRTILKCRSIGTILPLQGIHAKANAAVDSLQRSLLTDSIQTLRLDTVRDVS